MTGLGTVLNVRSPASSEWLCLLQRSRTLQCWVLGTCAVALRGCVGHAALAENYQTAGCWPHMLQHC